MEKKVLLGVVAPLAFVATLWATEPLTFAERWQPVEKLAPCLVIKHTLKVPAPPPFCGWPSRCRTV